MDSIQCLCCGQTAIHDAGSSIGRAMERTGYEPIMMLSTEVRWMCPECVERMIPHDRAICEVLGASSECVHWGGLRYLLKRKIGDVRCETKTS